MCSAADHIVKSHSDNSCSHTFDICVAKAQQGNSGKTSLRLHLAYSFLLQAHQVSARSRRQFGRELSRARSAYVASADGLPLSSARQWGRICRIVLEL